MKLAKIKPNLCRSLKKEIKERRKQFEIEKAWRLWEKHANTLYRLECQAKKGRKIV